MQNAKDSFYMALRSRLAVLSPERSVMVRGAVRPGIVVEEAEASCAQMADGVFVLRWLGMGVDMELAATMVALECEVCYQTCGSQSFGGLDRGRMLTAMDSELRQILWPMHTGKMVYTATPPAPLLTRVFWDEPVYGPVTTQRDRLSRAVKVTVYSYEEQGE